MMAKILETNLKRPDLSKKNVVEKFTGWTTEAIKASLDTNRLNYGVLIVNLIGDFNIGSVIRNSNAFMAKEVFIYGNKKFDRRGTVGTHHYTNFRHVQRVAELPNYPIVSVDNTASAVNMKNFVWPKEYFLMAFGEEGCGLPEEILDKSKSVVYIEQLGSVRSLNVGCASAVAMYDYTSKVNNV